MSLNKNGFRSELPDTSPYNVEMLVDETPPVTVSTAEEVEHSFTDAGIGTTYSRCVKDLGEKELKTLDRRLQRALLFSGSVIVDAGEGIGALVNATPQKEQEFSTLDINRALIDAGLIDSKNRVMKLGASGAVVEDERGAEVIEVTLFDERKKLKRVGVLSKAAWSDGEGQLHIDSLKDANRVLLENEFLVTENPIEKSNAVYVEVNVEANEVDLYSLLAQALEKVNMEHYTVRCTIEGPIKANVAVIKNLPTNPLNDISDVKEILVAKEMESNGVFHFVGSRTNQISRQNKKWGEITGNPVYSPNGHYHGYSEDGKVGGHILGIIPQQGAKIMLIIEPAKVAQVKKGKGY